MGGFSCLRGGANKGALSNVPQPVAAVVAVVMLLVTVIVAPSAQADETSSVPFSDHVVSNTVSPSGTTINLFDYWVQPYGCADIDDSYCNGQAFNHSDTGINAGKQLRFTYNGEGQNTINK